MVTIVLLALIVAFILAILVIFGVAAERPLLAIAVLIVIIVLLASHTSL